MNKHQLERFDNLQVHARLLGGACLSKKYGKCTDRLRWRCAEGLHLAGRRLGGRLVVRSPARAGRRAAGRRLGPGGGVGFVAERRMVASSVSGGGAEFIAQGRPPAAIRWRAGRTATLPASRRRGSRRGLGLDRLGVLYLLRITLLEFSGKPSLRGYQAGQATTTCSDGALPVQLVKRSMYSASKPHDALRDVDSPPVPGMIP